MGDTFDKVKEGVKKVAGKVEDTAEEGVKKAADTAENVVDPDTYTGSDKEGEKREYDEQKREYSEAGGKEPMKPEDIAAHEPTAVKRDQETDISEEGQTGTDNPEAREKYKKSGMTDTK
ncbi:MAG TPA: hypothetical protein VIP29_02685 [Nitrososphaeraceae archaeon]